METKITDFWNHFLAIQTDLIETQCKENLKLHSELFDTLNTKAVKIHPKIRIFALYIMRENIRAKLVFPSHGNNQLKALIFKIVNRAPYSDFWEFQIGVSPYNGSIIQLCSTINFFDLPTTVFQIYFAVQKIYKSSNKFHLIIYMELDRRYSKFDLQAAMDGILMLFLGDVLYFNHISRFKIVRRKYSAIRFLPLEELKNLIQYKNLN
ncbi:hypothetical protein [Aequorivita marisscotiae]|uniref:Uncharacterized protein n=1 Tax=Aequorivita marisscotiae TaxID=3040348 RepID=A0ABY8KRT6_9FLAO|nr:hypothetical protein [Aequorivita sp. Ant34-E75]WGF92174.1 hypothetical protein QCQ61_13295 [Aequorivita sp. Ant34-E75]